MASIHSAERQLLAAAQRVARKQVINSINAGLRDRHSSTVALVVAKFASRRAALASMPDASARVAAASQLAAEEAHELARLALEHAAEKRHLRKAAITPLTATQRTARRSLRQRQRRQRMTVAIQLSALARRSQAGSGPRTMNRHHAGKVWQLRPGAGGDRH